MHFDMYHFRTYHFDHEQQLILSCDISMLHTFCIYVIL